MDYIVRLDFELLNPAHSDTQASVDTYFMVLITEQNYLKHAATR
jgi:hypothetical protein